MRIETSLISPQSIEAHYIVLNHIGALGNRLDAGFSRAAYSDEETAVMSYFAEQATLIGLKIHWDAAGNLSIETTATQQYWIECGSHVDTVPGGGNFDGLAGIVAGFVAITSVMHQPRSHGLRLRIWRGEESASFGITSIGASAALGTLTAEHLNQRHAGRTLADAMGEQGGNPKAIQLSHPLIGQDELDHITAHIEVHIEQGIVLEKEQLDIGIVSGIRASSRDWITLIGEFDHSGATPMGQAYRRDANLALAHILVELDKLFTRYQSENKNIDLVQTIGHINSNEEKNKQNPELYNNAISKISGYAYFSFELRSCDDTLRNHYKQQAMHTIQQTAASFGVSVQIEAISNSTGVKILDQRLQDQIQSICAALNYSYRSLPSGAWHDAALMAQHKRSDQSTIPTAMIFIPCLNGKSHSPVEFASKQQIAKGASVLATLMMQNFNPTSDGSLQRNHL